MIFRQQTFLAALAYIVTVSSSVDGFNVGSNLKPKAKLTTEMTTPRKAVAIPMPDVQHENQMSNKMNLPQESAWVENLDFDAFAADVTALGKQLLKEQGNDDVEHLQKILKWQNAAALVGVATMWTSPNPITIAALSTWTYASWTMVAHHTCHGGYNRVDAGKYNSRGFALGSVKKRVEDWCDWMMPEAWNVEHNRLHHYHLGEGKDPDLVQRNLEFLRDKDVPMPLKYATVALFMPIWKWFYYAPNTFKELQIQKWRIEGKALPSEFDREEAMTVRAMLFPKSKGEEAGAQVAPPVEFFKTVLAPFFLSRFILLPAPLLAIPGVGPSLYGHALINLMVADFVTNIHGFITIVTNHAGEDIYTFEDEVKPKTGSFYVRQIVGSTNYQYGTDLVDFSHGWLNYQIEHHVWPDLSMLSYQRGAPRLKALCEKHGVPYVQENVFVRLKKTVNIMVGKSSMREYPVALEPAKDKAGKNGVSWKSTNGAINDN
jgi:hypothetical protein